MGVRKIGDCQSVSRTCQKRREIRARLDLLLITNENYVLDQCIRPKNNILFYVSVKTHSVLTQTLCGVTNNNDVTTAANSSEKNMFRVF